MSVAVGMALANNGTIATLMANNTWSERAETWFDSVLVGDLFTAEDLVKAVGLPNPELPKANNAVGAKIRKWSHGEFIAPIGYTKSGRSVSHARVIVIWERVK